MTLNLILWRHADAEDAKVEGRDLPRKLTRKGHKQAKRAAAYLRPKLPANARIIVSQAARSQQTADYLEADYQVLAAINPDVDVHTLPRLINSFQDDSYVVLVGHQPWIGQLCAFLLNQNWTHQSLWSVRKGAFWWFQVRSDNHVLHAKLKLALAPADLER